jgi:anthranilate phosphoribosyltransferase
MAHTWPVLLAALMRGESLDSAATAWAMDEMMAGEATPAQLAAFIVLLRAKGETSDELAGMVRAMRERATPVLIPGPAVDVVGTGGDLAHTVNITTMAALVVAGTGRKVVKHGNRSASSQCGSADVLEELGIVIDLGPEGVAATTEEVGIGFCFAPVFHRGMRHAGPPRREIGVPTAFNVLGPLTNPARPKALAVGVFDKLMAPIVAGVFARRGVEALVFRGDDGLDELTVSTTSTVWTASGGEVREQYFDPRDLGMELAPIETLRGADANHNAGVARRLLDGGERGPIRDAVLLTTAAALAALTPSSDSVTERLAAGVERAAAAIDSGAAAAALTRWVEVSERLAAGSAERH